MAPLILNLSAGWEELASRSCRFIPKEGSPSTKTILIGWAEPITGGVPPLRRRIRGSKSHWNNRKYGASKLRFPRAKELLRNLSVVWASRVVG
jgi:hypothetical protein